MKRIVKIVSLVVLLAAQAICASATQIYFQCTDGAAWWVNDGAKIGAIFRTGTTSSDYGLYTDFFTAVSGQTNMFEATIPENEEEFQSVQFLRFNSTATKVEWNNLWNTTGIISYDGTKNLFIANASGSEWDSTTGSWSTYSPTPGPTPTSDKIYLDCTSFDSSNNWSVSGAQMAVMFTNGTTSAYTDFMTQGTDGVYYATIPSGSWTSCVFIRYSSSATETGWADFWNRSCEVTYTGAYNKYKITGWDGCTDSRDTDNHCAGKWDTSVDPEPTEDGVTVYFKRPSGWADVPHIHAWKSQDPVSGSRVIYEISVLNYSSAGTFNAITNDMDRLKSLGVDVLWLMPIFQIGQQGKVGTYGSPYAIKDYYSVNSNYGSLTDFKNLVKAAHTNGMEVWLDIACNHTAIDCGWVSSNPVYYGYNPYNPEGWSDVYKLVYDYNGTNTALYTEMTNVLKYWVKECDIDGYRCDYATGVPTSFWTQARTAVDAIKQITWLAEGENDNYWSAFDIQYGWNFNDMLVKFAGDRSVSNLWTDCSNYYNSTKNTDNAKMTHLTNHDRSAYEGTEFERFGEVYNPLLVLSFTINDYPMIYMGQEIGWSVTTFVDKQAVNFNVQSSTADFYRNLVSKLVSLKHSSEALKDGSERGSLSRIYTNNDGSILAYERKSGDASVVTVLNFSSSTQSVTLNSAPSGTYADFIDGGTRTLSGSISIGAYGYKVFVK